MDEAHHILFVTFSSLMSQESLYLKPEDSLKEHTHLCTHAHEHTCTHTHTQQIQKPNSTKVHVNESANKFHFQTLGSFFLFQKPNRKVLPGLGQSWARLPGQSVSGASAGEPGRGHMALGTSANSLPSLPSQVKVR